MKELNNNKILSGVFVSEAKQDVSTVHPSQWVFSEETVTSLSEYGSILGRICKRLVAEGYIIKDGKIFKPDTDKQHGNS
jgi:hypothetical protein